MLLLSCKLTALPVAVPLDLALSLAWRDMREISSIWPIDARMASSGTVMVVADMVPLRDTAAAARSCGDHRPKAPCL